MGITKSRAAIQGDLDRLEERASRNFVKVKNDKCRDSQLRRKMFL